MSLQAGRGEKSRLVALQTGRRRFELHDQSRQMRCRLFQGLPFLAVERVFDVHSAGDGPLGRADVVEDQIRLHVPPRQTKDVRWT